MSMRDHILLRLARIITMLFPTFKRQNDTYNTAYRANCWQMEPMKTEVIQFRSHN